MAAAKKKTQNNPHGLKRICLNCDTRFYDMNKRPIVCPSCETEYTGAIKVRRRKSPVASDETKPSKVTEATESDETEEDEVEEDEDVISLDDAEELDGDDDGDDDDMDTDLDGDLDLDDDDDVDLDDDDIELGEPDADDLDDEDDEDDDK